MTGAWIPKPRHLARDNSLSRDARFTWEVLFDVVWDAGGVPVRTTDLIRGLTCKTRGVPKVDTIRAWLHELAQEGLAEHFEGSGRRPERWMPAGLVVTPPWGHNGKGSRPALRPSEGVKTHDENALSPSEGVAPATTKPADSSSARAKIEDSKEEPFSLSDNGRGPYRVEIVGDDQPRYLHWHELLEDAIREADALRQTERGEGVRVDVVDKRGHPIEEHP